MNPVELSKAYRLLYPAVPTIIGCNEGGKVYAMPVVSIISLSNDPPLIGVASSPGHSTHKAILKAGRFSVCWLDSSQASAIQFLGTTGHKETDKLRSAGLEHDRGRKLDVPVVRSAPAALECRLGSSIPVGDHELLVGKIEEASASDDFQGYWRFKRYRPVLYTGVREGALTTFQPGR